MAILIFYAQHFLFFFLLFSSDMQAGFWCFRCLIFLFRDSLFFFPTLNPSWFSSCPFPPIGASCAHGLIVWWKQQMVYTGKEPFQYFMANYCTEQITALLFLTASKIRRQWLYRGFSKNACMWTITGLSGTKEDPLNFNRWHQERKTIHLPPCVPYAAWVDEEKLHARILNRYFQHRQHKPVPLN